MKRLLTANSLSIIVLTIILVWAPPLFAIDPLAPPVSFSAGTTAKSADANLNFTNVYNKVNEMIQEMETMAQTIQNLEQKVSALELKSSMVRISAGTFTMGDDYRNNSQPPHEVTLSKDFYIMNREVTAGEYKECVDDGECTYSGSTSDPLRTYDVSGKENHPINFVSWNDAQAYIQWRNQEGIGHNYRLCTEAEWEYAARAGTTTKYSCGDDSACLDAIAWYADNNTPEGTKTVKTKQPNAWGLYDMQGNISEWVQDWMGSYGSGPVTDPTGPASAQQKVARYPGFDNEVLNMGVTVRGDAFANSRHVNLGFRLCGSK